MFLRQRKFRPTMRLMTVITQRNQKWRLPSNHCTKNSFCLRSSSIPGYDIGAAMRVLLYLAVGVLGACGGSSESGPDTTPLDASTDTTPEIECVNLCKKL